MPDRFERKLMGEKIEDISQCAAGSFIDFSIFALGACHGRKLFALHVKDLREKAAGCSKFSDFVLLMSAFGAFVI